MEEAETHIKELTGAAFSTLHSGNIEANSNDGNVLTDGSAGKKQGVNLL